jgi:DNA replication protein DnaC
MSKAVSVKVVVRCRPLSRTETANGANICAEIDEAAHTIKINDPSGTVKQAKTFTFDHTYSLTSTQQQVYDDIGQPVIQQALDGYNSTIFAYGQTGSGKVRRTSEPCLGPH